MKKDTLLNSSVISTLSKLGHTDQITICDAGFPIPDEVQRIDLAITKGIPSFLDVLRVTTTGICVEHIVLADEIKEKNEKVHELILADIKKLEKIQDNIITIEYVMHESFKMRTKKSKAIIRTGECTPYANIILCAGTLF